jgi:HPt (histidine-containing phosphotransfer) domain-containing protein
MGKDRLMPELKISEELKDYLLDSDYAPLVIGYIESFPRRLQALFEARDKGDMQGLRKGVHDLIGAGIFGFYEVSRLAKLLERHVDDGELEKVQQTFEPLVNYMKLIHDNKQTYLVLASQADNTERSS